ncbi:MAG: CopG family transcriptional regulator [Anaerolineae bacterium]|nr:CopG family transcriptional regulator [Anaerolineae bacterium]
MNVAKVTISLDQVVLDRIDQLVQEQLYPNRSQVIQVALVEKMRKLDKPRLRRECVKLDKVFERELANEGLATEVAESPEY